MWTDDVKIKEECGVFGAYRTEEPAMLAYFGLHALQHRGQEGAGIACADGEQIICRKGCGLLTDVFRPQDLEELQGHSCIGHVRYATAGGGELENVQPLVARSHMGSVAVVHNGQIVNWKAGAAFSGAPATARSSSTSFKGGRAPCWKRSRPPACGWTALSAS